MSDISMCANETCTLKESCWRFNAPVNEYRQSYGDFKQKEDLTCDHYWGMKEVPDKQEDKE